MKKNLRFVLLGAILFFIDRISKIYFSKNNFLIFHFFKNYSGLFGIFNGPNFLFIILSVILLIILVYLSYRKDYKTKLGATLISSGILSNLFDRLFLGYIVDFIDFGFWPIFNLADVFILTGVIILMGAIFKCK